MTWAEIDALERERQEKARECVERLAKILTEEFSYQELRFIGGWANGAIEIEAFEIARNKTQGR
jgi:hypothetical protein